MHLVYIDDSGDEKVRCYSALIIHENHWKAVREMIREHRRRLKRSDGMLITRELHATEFVAGRGRLGPQVVAKGRRCEIFRDTLTMIAGLPNIGLLNAVSAKTFERTLFERLMNRINTCMSRWNSNALIIHDEGKDYTNLIRRMSVYNPIKSRYSHWPDGKLYNNKPLNRVIEDIVYRKSHESDLIQMADFCAYALLRSEYPIASKNKYGLNRAFNLLHPICVKEANNKDRLGIIRCP